MGVLVSDPPHYERKETRPSTLNTLLKIFSVVRYRFFLYAGLLPYLLGSAWAWGMHDTFRPGIFWTGFCGIFLSVVGVEAFNEYFDSRMGTDRVFNPDDEDPIEDWVLYLGIAAFIGAASVGFYLAREGGWPIVLYTLLGGMAAVWYVGPPVRWVYRGLGEAMIGLSYGPWMVLGALHLQIRAFDAAALLASLVPGLLIMSLAVVNSIPDFHQDRLVGKRNLCVRFGQAAAVCIYTTLSGVALGMPVLGVVLGWFGPWTLLTLGAVPLLVDSARKAQDTYHTPLLFVPAVRSIVLCYLVGTSLFTVGLLAGKLF